MAFLLESVNPVIGVQSDSTEPSQQQIVSFQSIVIQKLEELTSEIKEIKKEQNAMSKRVIQGKNIYVNLLDNIIVFV